MSADPVMYVRDLIAARDDPRILLLDARLPSERARLPLGNHRFSEIWTSRDDLAGSLPELATLVGQRHVVVIDTSEQRAVAASRLLCSIEVHAAALEGGLAGWTTALRRLAELA